MAQKKGYLTAMILVAAGMTGLNAQQTVAASGGNGTGTGGSVSYTAGQVAYTTIAGSGGSVSQGVQQPYEISVVTSVKDADNITLQFIVYPNPATDYLILKIKGVIESKYTSYLYDTYGSLVQTQIVESNETTIPMDNLSPSIYFLKIVQWNREVKTFKIIKR